jgi:nitric oxide reductase activation protein
MLGRKLQIRAEIKTTKFTRLNSGKIDKRLLAAVGFQGENLFYQTSTDKYKNVHLHVSVDASSSMGPKWKKTMTTLVAIAKAASMINNVSVCISFRSGISSNSSRGDHMPYIVMAYDSRKDKFNKIVQLFHMLYPAGSTPEGLTFQAILKHIPMGTHELDSYFVNISDGEPAFDGGYYGAIAAKHTKKQVSKIREAGVSVISYFVESADSIYAKTSNETTLFRTMYGKDAQFIDVRNITQVAHTLNKKFLSKES